MSTAATQPRGVGGKFAPKAPSPPAVPDIPDAPVAAPVSATAELARLKAQRLANGGLLLPKPEGIDAAAIIYPAHGGINDGIPLPNRALQAAEAWFTAIVAAGGSPADLQLAWHRWQPRVAGSANPKARGRTLTMFEQLCVEAQRQYLPLLQRAEAERAPERHASARAAALCRLEAQAAQLRAELAPVEAQIAQLRGQS